MAVVNYFETQISEIEKSDGQMKIELADFHGKDLTDVVDLCHYLMGCFANTHCLI